MTTTTPASTTTTSSGTLAGIGAGTALLAAAGTVYGAHSWPEIWTVVAAIAVSAVVAFGFVVPRALRKESAGGTALGLSVPAALLLLPAFWSGLPLVLGAAGMIVGNAGRRARTGAGKCTAAVALGGLAAIGYVAIYVVDAMASGGGFLFD